MRKVIKTELRKARKDHTQAGLSYVKKGEYYIRQAISYGGEIKVEKSWAGLAGNIAFDDLHKEFIALNKDRRELMEKRRVLTLDKHWFERAMDNAKEAKKWKCAYDNKVGELEESLTEKSILRKEVEKLKREVEIRVGAYRRLYQSLSDKMGKEREYEEENEQLRKRVLELEEELKKVEGLNKEYDKVLTAFSLKEDTARKWWQFWRVSFKGKMSLALLVAVGIVWVDSVSRGLVPLPTSWYWWVGCYTGWTFAYVHDTFVKINKNEEK